MHSDLTNHSSSQHQNAKQKSVAKQPRLVLDDQETPHQILAFPPNRDTLGGTAYLIVEEVTILVDCPAWDDTTRSFLQERSVDWLVLTHRGGMGQVKEIQQTLKCNVLIQEQEAYLLPGLTVTHFERSFALTAHSRVIWTPGHSPGSSCLYYSGFGGVLFSGRHLLPSPQGQLLPLKTAKTFHWRRQLRSTQHLRDEFTPATLNWICPGANTGFLRGKYAVEKAYQQLAEISLEDSNCKPQN